jgi:hypothetical protein
MASIGVTRDRIRAGRLLKVGILDYVIVGGPGSEQTKPSSSLRERGFFTQPGLLDKKCYGAIQTGASLRLVILHAGIDLL